MKTIPSSRHIFCTAQSFFTTWALMKAGRMQPGNILTGIFFLFALVFYCYAEKRLKGFSSDYQKKISVASLITSIIFSILYMAVDYPVYIETLTNPLFRIGIIVSVFLGFTALFYHLLQFLFSVTGNKVRLRLALFVPEQDLSGQDPSAQNPRLQRHPAAKYFARLASFYGSHMGLCAFFLCLLCWLPYLLYQYPGIMTPDSLNQFEQVLGVIPYSNHHPWVHTLLIKLLYSIGFQITGSMLVALSYYTVFQMCLLSWSVCYFINTLGQFRIKPIICLAITLFYALVPYHAVYSVTLWKDIPFACAVLAFGCSTLRLASGNASPGSFALKSPRLKRLKAVGDLCIFGICGLMICLFRSNGWYAFLLCLPFLLFFFRKKAKTMIPVLLCILFAAVIIKYPVMNAFHVTQPDLVESLSIPIQQITAVICNDRPLQKEEVALIENVVDLTYIKKLYDIHYADNIKELIRAGNQDYLREHKGDFFKLWVTLGLRYPGDYLTAYIHQTYGYWYPDSFYPVADAEGVSATLLGVSHTPLIRGPLVVKTKEIAIKLGGMLPLYGIFWSMGAACWVLIFCIGNTFVREERQKLILYLPSAALLFTVLIATPVATEFRYVYFMVFSMPFYLMAAMLPMPSNSSFEKS